MMNDPAVLEESGHVDNPQKRFSRGGIVAGAGRRRVECRAIPGACPPDQVEGEGLQQREHPARHGIEEVVVQFHLVKAERHDFPAFGRDVAVGLDFVTSGVVVLDADARALAQFDRLTTELADEFGEFDPAFGFAPGVARENTLIVGECGFNVVSLRAGYAVAGADLASVEFAVATAGSGKPLAVHGFAACPVVGASPEP
ncbi:MAG: hypothetical protein FLDDKLPJ_00801 [Phycisphaerae bacterium]|nr:hypothetical protein [Phycisphaerae bacterium]